MSEGSCFCDIDIYVRVLFGNFIVSRKEGRVTGQVEYIVCSEVEESERCVDTMCGWCELPGEYVSRDKVALGDGLAQGGKFGIDSG